MKASVTLTLTKDIADIPKGSSERTKFATDFVSDLSKSLKIPIDRIVITNIASGSVIVSFDILPSSSLKDPPVMDVVSNLQKQVSDPKSHLLHGSVTNLVDTSKNVFVQTIETKPALVPSSEYVGPQEIHFKNGLKLIFQE